MSDTRRCPVCWGTGNTPTNATLSVGSACWVCDGVGYVELRPSELHRQTNRIVDDMLARAGRRP